MTGIVYINGKWYDEKKAKIGVFDPGLMYGDGVFDTCRVYNGRAFELLRHIDRLYNSAGRCNITIPFTKEELINLIQDGYHKSKLIDAFIRIMITSISSIIIIHDRPEQLLRPVKIVGFLGSRYDPQSKSLNYLESKRAKRWANSIGYDDAYFWDEKEGISECTTSNIFIVKDGIIKTPFMNILQGITREVIIENFKVEVNNISIDELRDADEVFLAGTVDMINIVKHVDGRDKLKYSTAEKIAAKLQELTKRGFKL